MSFAAALAQGDAGRESPFTLGAGARGMGMGRAFVALSGDASASLWNPAATASIDRSEFVAFHTSLFMGTNYDCLALSHPVGTLGVFSLSAGRLGTGDITEWDQYNRPVDTFSASDFLLGLSYGRGIGYGLATGLTVKGVGQEIGGNSGYGFGLDLGFQYRPYFAKGAALGLSFRDLVQPSIKLIEVRDKYETVTSGGMSYSRDFSHSFGSTAAVEVERIPGRKTHFHAGGEAAFYRSYFLRVGYDRDRLAFGAGIIYNFFKLDYGYENIDYLGASHRISLGVSFGKSVAEAREEMIGRAVEAERANWQKEADRQRNGELAMNLGRADSLRGEGQYQNALLFYNRALAADETSQKARTMSDSMMSLIIAGASASARDARREELTSKRIASALELMKSARYGEAVTQYELALEIDPSNKTVADLLEAARVTRAEELDKMRGRARQYRDAGDFASSLLEWNRVLSLQPDDSEAKQGIEIARSQLQANGLLAAGVASMNEGKYSGAATYLEQAQKIKPRDKTIQTLLADARAKSAPATNLEDIKASPERWAIYLKGLEAYQEGNYSDAIRSWESLRQFYPNNPDLEKNISQARQRISTEGGARQE